MRLNKYIAHAGICSRRKAADLVKSGKIKLNGTVERNPAVEVGPEDKVSYQGKIIRPESKKIYLLLNKPKAVVTTASDEKNRKTVLDLVSQKIVERIYPVGRLDFNTSGLLLLTNDGDLAEKLSHPRYEVQKIYHIRLDKECKLSDLEKLRSGLIIW